MIDGDAFVLPDKKSCLRKFIEKVLETTEQTQVVRTQKKNKKEEQTDPNVVDNIIARLDLEKSVADLVGLAFIMSSMALLDTGCLFYTGFNDKIMYKHLAKYTFKQQFNHIGFEDDDPEQSEYIVRHHYAYCEFHHGKNHHHCCNPTHLCLGSNKRNGKDRSIRQYVQKELNESEVLKEHHFIKNLDEDTVKGQKFRFLYVKQDVIDERIKKREKDLKNNNTKKKKPK